LDTDALPVFGSISKTVKESKRKRFGPFLMRWFHAWLYMQ